MASGKLSFGVVGALDRTLLRELAPKVEAAGFHALWLNDTPDGNSLEGLSIAAEVTSTLRLATGVIPLDRKDANAIADDVERFNLPQERLVLGVGTGMPKGGLQRLEDSIGVLRERVTAPIVFGALGPKVRELGANLADGLLLSWLTPGAAKEAMADLKRDQQTAGRTGVQGILYTRTAVTPKGLRDMIPEATRYQSYPAYARHFTSYGAKAMDTTIYETEADRLQVRIHDYNEIVDELVLRAIPGEQTLDAYLQIVRMATEK